MYRYNTLWSLGAASSAGRCVRKPWFALDLACSLSPRERQIGLGSDSGISTYYSSNIERADVQKVQE